MQKRDRLFPTLEDTTIVKTNLVHLYQPPKVQFGPFSLPLLHKFIERAIDGNLVRLREEG